MNLNDEQAARLEARLRKLRPAAVPPALLARLRAKPPVISAWRAPWRWLLGSPALWPTAAATVAAIIFCTVFGHRVAPGPAGAPRVGPVANAAVPAPAASMLAGTQAAESADYVVGARKLGVWTSPEGRPYNVIQCLALNRTVWRNDGRKTEFEQLEPRQRLLLVAMDTQ